MQWQWILQFLSLFGPARFIFWKKIMKTTANIILGLCFSVLYSESFIIIVPGTNYCGAGELEQKIDPLYPGTDNCCRDHDYCPEKISMFSTKFELWNFNPFTISLCECDEAFRSCLKEVGSNMSATIGKTYFNDLMIPCFELKEEKGLKKAELKYPRKFWINALFIPTHFFSFDLSSF